MEETDNQVPVGTVMTIKVPLDRSKTQTATFYLKEMTEDVFLASKSLMDVGKQFDAVRLIIKSLSLSGSDQADVLKTNFIAMNSMRNAVIELIEPIDAEVKKN